LGKSEWIWVNVIRFGKNQNIRTPTSGYAKNIDEVFTLDGSN